VEVSERYADGRAAKEELSAAQASAAEALRQAIEECRPLDALLCAGFPGLSQREKAEARARRDTAARCREAAKAAKAAARPTDRASMVAEEMNRAACWAREAEAIGGTAPVILARFSKYSDLLRCLFGNPFRPTQLARTCVTEEAARLALAIYEEASFQRLPSLADALEEGGCASADALAHCRGPGPHARGCWVVDMLLGKG
jgi:hypothetical protein